MKEHEIIEDRSRCDHPFESLEIHSAHEHRSSDSMAPVAATYSVIVYCNKCKTFILMSSDYSDWNSALYSKLVLNNGILAHDEYPYCQNSEDPDQNQAIFFNNIKLFVENKHHNVFAKPEILEWIWKNHPEIMSKFVSMINEAAAKAIKK
jgi:hypothetical protein